MNNRLYNNFFQQEVINLLSRVIFSWCSVMMMGSGRLVVLSRATV